MGGCIIRGNEEKYSLSDDKIETLVRDYDLIISEEKNVVSMPGKAANVYEQYKYGDSLHIERSGMHICYCKKKNILIMQKIWIVYLKGKYTCFCNMYIMKKELFHEYMEWLFSILFEFEKEQICTIIPWKEGEHRDIWENGYLLFIIYI